MASSSERVAGRIALLLVDDDAEFLDILRRRFTRRGLATTAGGDPRMALDAAHRQRFDVAIVDRSLRTSDGISLLKQLKQVDPRTQVIMLSGHADAATAAAALEAGASEYLLKPCGLAELEAAIDRALPAAS